MLYPLEFCWLFVCCSLFFSTCTGETPGEPVTMRFPDSFKEKSLGVGPESHRQVRSAEEKA